MKKSSIRLLDPHRQSRSAAAASAQTDAQKAFTAIKTHARHMAGNHSQWPGSKSRSKLVSGGSAVMSEIRRHTPRHDQHDQPRWPQQASADALLRYRKSAAHAGSVSPDGKTITFSFVDATNLAAPDAGHMQKMVLTMLDDNHHTEEWVFVDHGKEHKATIRPAPQELGSSAVSPAVVAASAPPQGF